MRGKQKPEINDVLEVGITPAHAGKTIPKTSLLLFDWDHPRACGENQKEQYNRIYALGSPPRMRGKQMIGFGLHCRMRITPAHAGKTATRTTFRLQKKDHPRACGENKSPKSMMYSR